MMNVLALGLLLSSLAAAGVWTPHPPDPKPPHHDPHLMKEGHRLIVLEYERQGPHEPSDQPPSPSHIIQEAKDKLEEASSFLPSLGQGISTPQPAQDPTAPTHPHNNVICDAFGTCKDKLTGLFTKAKGTATKLEEGTKETVKGVVDKASDTVTKLEEGVTKKSNEAVTKVSEKATQLERGAKDTVKDAVEKTKQFGEKAATKVSDKATQLEEGAKETVKDAVEKTKEVGEDVAETVAYAARDVHGNLTDIFRRARDVAYDLAEYAGAARAVVGVAHLVAVAVSYGTCVWVTFVSSHVLARALPRQQFGIVQSKVYPVYFRLMAYSVGVALVAHFIGGDRGLLAERVQVYNLLAALGLVLANLLWLEPKATKVMFERMKMEKEEGRGRDMADVVAEQVVTSTPVMTSTTTATVAATRTTVAVDQEAVKSRVVKLNKRLKSLNTYSSFLNVMTLMCLTWHLVHLSWRLQVKC